MSEILKYPWTKFKKPAAVAGSLVLHALVLLALVPSSASQLSPTDVNGGGLSDVEGIEIDLVGIHDSTEPPATRPASAASTPMDLFSEMAETDMVPAQTDGAVSKPQTLTEALGENPFQPKASAEARTASEAHVKINNADRKTVNDLWKAIEPCWKRVSDRSTVNVTLEVSFSLSGRLSKPPIIKRPAHTDLNDNRLRSENQAITALAQCGPYMMAYGQEGVQIQFPSRKG